MVAKALRAGELDISCRAARTVPGMVRAWVEFRLCEWGLERVSDEVLLIVGELVANAVESTPGLGIRFRCTRGTRGVMVAVWDSSGHMPVLRPVREVDDVVADARALEPGHEEGGRGLQIVRALAADYGFTMTAPVGKWVWAAVAC